jgi:hypothetical protein
LDSSSFTFFPSIIKSRSKTELFTMSEKHIESRSEEDVVVERRGSKINPEKSQILTNLQLLNDAYAGEDREHAMGLWEAAKTHPKACIWAFIMCFTIVSLPHPPSSHNPP